MDFLVGETLVVQIEAVDEIEYNHEAELRTAVRFGGFVSGLLLNFNVVKLEDGIRQIAGGPNPLPSDFHDVFDDPDLLASL